MQWSWSEKEKQAFKLSKELLLSSQVLVHFDRTLEITLACDASAYGRGAVLSHCFPDGTVGFVFRTLTEMEKSILKLKKRDWPVCLE